jgi:hypothetical protein
MKPKARSEHLIKQVVGDETLVFDSRDESALRLNQVSSTVWRHCTGANTVEQIAVLLAAEVALPADADAVAVVWGVLEELEGSGLLLPADPAAPGVGRREVMATLVALPIFPSIDKIFAPTMANAASNPPDPTPTPTGSATPSASRSATSSFAVSQSVTASSSPFPVTQSVTASSSPFPVTQSATTTRTPTATQTRTPTATTAPGF